MNRPGRPRKSSIDEQILDALAGLIVERGYPQVTVDEVVRRAGTNKPAFYRRFRDIAAVVPRLLAARHGLDADIDTGTLVGDLVEVLRRQLAMFTDPVVVRGFAGWTAQVAADAAQTEAFVAGYLAPRRAYTSVILDRAIARKEIPAGADPGWVADVLTGPLLMHVVMPGLAPVDAVLVERSIHSALDAVSFEGDRSGVRIGAARPLRHAADGSRHPA